MNDAQRAKLIEEHGFLIGKAVKLVWPRVMGYAEREDLEGAGGIGLVEAARRYDPASGTTFATFAWYRVQGEILDQLRRQRNLPRRVFAQLMALQSAGEVLESRAGVVAAARARNADARKTADRLAEVREAMGAIQACFAMVTRGGIDLDEVLGEAESPADVFDRRAFASAVDAAMAALPERERKLVEKHYLEGKSLAEAGDELGLSRSWASRLHAQAIDKLRRQLGPEPDSS